MQKADVLAKLEEYKGKPIEIGLSDEGAVLHCGIDGHWIFTEGDNLVEIVSQAIMNACKSNNFLAEGDSIITIKRLLDTYNSNFFDTYDSLVTVKEKAKYLVDTVIGLTGLKDFGEYIYKLAVIDGLFLNEDRHFHNIAVIQKKNNTLEYTKK